MEVRSGFISNSSSTSFVLVAKTIDYEAALNNVPPHVKKLITDTGNTSVQCGKFNGASITVCSATHIDHYAYSLDNIYKCPEIVSESGTAVYYDKEDCCFVEKNPPKHRETKPKFFSCDEVIQNEGQALTELTAVIRRNGGEAMLLTEEC